MARRCEPKLTDEEQDALCQELRRQLAGDMAFRMPAAGRRRRRAKPITPMGRAMQQRVRAAWQMILDKDDYSEFNALGRVIHAAIRDKEERRAERLGANGRDPRVHNRDVHYKISLASRSQPRTATGRFLPR